MKYRFVSPLPPSVLQDRFSKWTDPLTKASQYGKSARLYACKGNRFTLMQNGERGRIRPFRVFRGRLYEREGGSALEGRFGLSLADRMLAILPALLIGAAAVAVSLPLALPYKVIFYGAAVFSVLVPAVFLSFMSRFMGTENEKSLLLFLERNIAGGEPPAEE